MYLYILIYVVCVSNKRIYSITNITNTNNNILSHLVEPNTTSQSKIHKIISIFFWFMSDISDSVTGDYLYDMYSTTSIC